MNTKASKLAVGIGELYVWEERLVRVVDVPHGKEEYSVEVIIAKFGLHPEKGAVTRVAKRDLFTVKAWAEKTEQGIVTFGKED